MQQHGRLKRRMLGLLAARLPEAKLEEVEDPRDGLDHRFGHRGGRSWPPPVALTPAYVMFGQFRT